MSKFWNFDAMDDNAGMVMGLVLVLIHIWPDFGIKKYNSKFNLSTGPLNIFKFLANLRYEES